MNTAWTDIYLWLFTALFWLAALMVVAGLLMILLPRWILSINQRLDVWVDTSGLFRKLDESQNLERVFYRHHIIMGALIVVGALYSLKYLWQLRENELLLLLPDISDPLLADWIHASVSILLLTGNGLALVMGIIVLLRPSLLKRLEARVNTWVNSEGALQTLDSRMEGANRVVSRHLRLFGVLVVIGSLYIMTNTITVVLR